MSEIKKFAAILDANVLFPAPLRDFLLRLAEVGVYSPKWSDPIHDEWIRNLLIKRPDLKLSQLNKVREAMDGAFAEANVTGFKSLITGLSLPDEDDRHVLAAAIKSEAELIITFNKKDFPPKNIQKFKIQILDPDEFVLRLLQIDLPKVLQAFLNQVNALKKTPQTIEQVLVTLGNCGLVKSVVIIRDLLSPADI